MPGKGMQSLALNVEHNHHSTTCLDAVLQTQLQAHRFFGRPKLALDAVGGDSAGRIAEALEQVRSMLRQVVAAAAAGSMLLKTNRGLAMG
jgi:hypothetical protein